MRSGGVNARAVGRRPILVSCGCFFNAIFVSRRFVYCSFIAYLGNRDAELGGKGGSVWRTRHVAPRAKAAALAPWV